MTKTYCFCEENLFLPIKYNGDLLKKSNNTNPDIVCENTYFYFPVGSFFCKIKRFHTELQLIYIVELDRTES